VWKMLHALQQLFPYKSSYSFIISTVIKSHSLMMEASNLATLIFPVIFVSIAHNFMKSRSHDGLAEKGLFT